MNYTPVLSWPPLPLTWADVIVDLGGLPVRRKPWGAESSSPPIGRRPPYRPSGSYGVVMDDDCWCEFDYVEPDGEESWHYRATCRACGTVWGALHCEHDGVQNPCPSCGWRDPGTKTAMEFLGL